MSDRHTNSPINYLTVNNDNGFKLKHVYGCKNLATIGFILHDFPGLENLNFKLHDFPEAARTPNLLVTIMWRELLKVNI